jgi:hypothetical protein
MQDHRKTTPAFVGRQRDFDFLVGSWNVYNRRLRRRHEGSSDWDEFAATTQGWSLLDGGVSVDEIRFASKGFAGCTIRTLDHATQSWSIYWINSNVGRLFPPVVGGFAGDRGEFYGADTDDGRRVEVRFIWQRGAERARWEQAFALDGRDWETNWVMQFTRA